MSDDEWLRRLAAALRTSGVDAGSARQVVDEARAHLRDAGAHALRVFGAPERYARAVAASLDVPAPPALPADGAAGGRPSVPPRLEVRGVCKRFGRLEVLRDVDLVVRAGEIAAVVGANGSGKSTLLHICAGLVAPDRGGVRIDGTVGYCPQDGGMVDLLLPDEHYVLFGAGRDLDRRRARQWGRAQADELSWSAHGRTLVRDLSGGTRQKLNLVLSNMGDPDVLLLDEPYQGFDRGTYVDFWEIVWRWRDAGRAIVVVTHMLNHLDRVDTVLDLSRRTEAVAR